MSDHLPECDWLWERHREFIIRGESGDRCTVCDALRVCEERVLLDLRPNLHVADMQGWNRGLTAARDAASRYVSDCYAHTALPKAEGVRAAIDALRGTS